MMRFKENLSVSFMIVPYFSSVVGTVSMSSKTWFSPAMAQIKVYAAVPAPEWMDQDGEITDSSFFMTI